jgi:hypothetical protein
MPQPAKDAIRECVDQFVEDVSALVREAALEAVQSALGQVSTGARAVGGGWRRSPGRKLAPWRRVRAASAAKAAKAAKARAGKRIRRSGDDIGSLAQAVVTEVRRGPGRRLGEIAASLGESAKSIRRPVVTLMEDGSLRSEGERGGTRYFPGGAKRRSPSAKSKAARKKKRGRTRRKAPRRNKAVTA